MQAVSFTTHLWSSDLCPTSLLSLTACWVDTVSHSTFTLQSAVLQANEFRGSRAGTSIAEKIEETLTWNFHKSNVNAV